MIKFGFFLGLNIEIPPDIKSVLEKGIQEIIENVTHEEVSEDARVLVSSIPALCHSIMEVGLDRAPDQDWSEEMIRQTAELVCRTFGTMLDKDRLEGLVKGIYVRCLIYQTVFMNSNQASADITPKTICMGYPERCDRCQNGGLVGKERLAPCKF